MTRKKRRRETRQLWLVKDVLLARIPFVILKGRPVFPNKKYASRRCRVPQDAIYLDLT